MMATAITASAKTIDGIIAYVDGQQTVYMLSDSPEVAYKNGYAILYVNGKKAASVNLTGDKTLSISYGSYDTETTAITITENANSNKGVTKYIDRGHIVILDENGNQFSVTGQRIK